MERLSFLVRPTAHTLEFPSHRSARLFARALGEADAIAAEQTRFEDSLHIDTSDEG